MNYIWKRWALSAVAGLTLGTLSGFSQEPTPIVTRNADLRLPVQIDERARLDIAELRLYVHGPSGKTELVQSALPTQTSFDFKAKVDGEYRFTFVTVDRRGQASPANVDAVPPHRVVVVDATPPEVSAEVVTLRGEKVLKCQIQDQNPDWASLRVLYKSPDGKLEPLMPVGAESPMLFRLPIDGGLSGKFTLTAADRAGNRTTRDVDPSAPSTPAMTKAPLLDRGKPDPTLFPKDVDPITTPSPDRGLRGVGYSDVPKSPRGDTLPVPTLPDMPPAVKSADAALDIKIPDSPPAVKVPDAPNVRLPDAPSERIPDPSSLKIPDPSSLKIPDPSALKIPDPPATPGLKDNDYKMPDKVPEPPPVKMPEEKLPVRPVARPTGDLDLKLPDLPPATPMETPGIRAPLDIPPPPPVPPVKNTTSTMKPSDVTAPRDLPKTPKAEESHPVLNSRVCTINYQLEGGARFSSRTDFWATPDSGRTWIPLKDSSGGGSPAKLTMPGDGIFGIRIRPNGGSKAPESGEEPDCLVEIDTTKPEVNLQSPTISGDDGTMILTWTAADTNLLSNAISLYYKSEGEAAWNVIVSGYKNEGVYRWSLPNELKGPIYLRLEAVDRAGNVGRVELNAPVALDAGKQRVKVIGVGPAK